MPSSQLMPGTAIVIGRITLAAACFLFAPAYSRAQGQAEGDPSARFQLSETVDVPLADREVRRRVDQAEAYLTAGHHAEAIAIYNDLLRSPRDGLLSISPTRYLGVHAWIRIRMARLSPSALSAYRAQVDPAARSLFEQGIAERDASALRRVVERYPVSRFADDAIDALAQIALERGQFDTARTHWETLIPPATAEPAQEPTWFAYPDTDLPLSELRARLVLTSIVEGDASRAERELDALRRLHPEATGTLGGKNVDLADALADLLEASRTWPDRGPRVSEWPTFAGSDRRQRVLDRSFPLGRLAWTRTLPEVPGSRDPRIPGGRMRAPAVGEDANSPLSYYPVVHKGIVFVGTASEIRAYRLDDGSPAWGDTAVIYRDPYAETVPSEPTPGDPDAGARTDSGSAFDFYTTEAETSDASPFHAEDSLTPPRFTLTVAGGRLFARMGHTATSYPDRTDYTRLRPGYLVCLDLAAEGRLLWMAEPDDPRFAFEGTPLADSERVYVAMRRSDIRSRAYVACLDAKSGAMLWRTFVAGAETPQQGRLHLSTHDLLARRGDTLFYNTNLGAVAAVDVHAGRLLWLNLYPRKREGSLWNLAPHASRELNPCLYDRGRLYVAPRDAAPIFCFHAADGRLLWQSRPIVEDAVHLLGVLNGCLVASGDRLYWIETDGEQAGRVTHHWPESDEDIGFGRGLLAGGEVYLPTRESVLVFDGETAAPVAEYPLAAMGIASGHLISAGRYVLIIGSRGFAAVRVHRTNVGTPAAKESSTSPELR